MRGTRRGRGGKAGGVERGLTERIGRGGKIKMGKGEERKGVGRKG